MGQVSGGLSSSAGIAQGVFNMIAGATIAQNDLVQLGPNGKAYPVQCTDNAAVTNVSYGTQQNSTATGQIIGATQVEAVQSQAQSRHALLQGDDGSVFTFSRGSGSYQSLSKYSAAGALLGNVQLDVGVSNNSYSNHHLFRLSNGNICVVAHDGTTSRVRFAIFTQSLVQVLALTSIPEDAVAADVYFSACALSGGGFAIVYRQNANSLLSRLVTYDNAGTVSLIPTTIWTRTGTTGTQYHRMAQLSSGDLVIAVSSANTVSSIGLFHGIVTTAGVSVKAFTNLDPASSAVIPELSVMTGYYAIGRHNGLNNTAYVFGNTGLQQGAGFSGTNGNGADSAKSKLINDGTAFWLIWPRSSDSKEVLTKLPTAGIGYVTTDITTSGTSNYNLTLDAFIENGMIFGISQVSGAQPAFWVVSLATQQLFAASSTKISGAGGTPDGYIRAIPGGDFSFITLFGYSTTASTQFHVGKYANTAVMGVAQTGGAADGLTSIAGVAGGYAANYIKGSPSKSFDHSAANIMGNKGAIMNYGAVLKGF